MPSPGSSPDAHGSRWSWLLPAGTFLAGCVLGGVVMGVADVGGGDQASTSPRPGADSGGRGEDSGAASDRAADARDSGLYVRVPASCVQTADGATTLVEHVDRVVAAVADLEPEPLRQTVDDVQQIRDAVQDAADQCRAAAEQRLQESADAEGGDGAPATPAS